VGCGLWAARAQRSSAPTTAGAHGPPPHPHPPPPRPRRAGEVLHAAKEGLFLSRDGTWSMLRKTWQPAFHSDSLSGYAPGMAREARRLVGRLARVASAGEPTDIWRDVGRMTMSVVGSAAYGVDFHLFDAEGEGEGGAGAGGQGATLVQAAADMFKGSEIGAATRYLVAAHLMPVMLPLIRLLAAAFPDERYRRLIKVGVLGGGAGGARAGQGGLGPGVWGVGRDAGPLNPKP
jgi:hypothetical protein